MKMGRRVSSEPPLTCSQSTNCASNRRGSRGPTRPILPNSGSWGPTRSTLPNSHLSDWQKLRCTLALLLAAVLAPAHAPAADPPSAPVQLLATNGMVEVLRAGATTWDFASTHPEKNQLHPGDRLRTRRHAEATLRLTDRSVVRVGPLSHVRVLQPLPRQISFELIVGKLFKFGREDPSRITIQTAAVSAAVDGTEFNVQVNAEDDMTRLDLFDGKVTLSNAHGKLGLISGQAAEAIPGQAPIRVRPLPGINVIQWNLYYPAVVYLDDLYLPETVQLDLAETLNAYRAGNLAAALARYPVNRTPVQAAEKLFLAGLLLAAGDLVSAEEWLETLSDEGSLTVSQHTVLKALHLLIAAVKLQPRPGDANSIASLTHPATTDSERTLAPLAGVYVTPWKSSSPTASLRNWHDPEKLNATIWLAESYFQQSRHHLENAREAARRAVDLAPDFGFALARFAELEFSFGRIRTAQEALQQSLDLAPQNAAAVTLQGFLFAAQNQASEAESTFSQALELDSGLADAWLGRGLIRIQQGRIDEGREDLLVAAATEPQRAVLRSYLGKAWTEEGETEKARVELEMAEKLDPNDPTAWLYLALLDHLDNRINAAVRSMEHSLELNDNRRVYRSSALLDQDQAVRGVNLANLYRDAGMQEVAYREAVQAVHEDYANFSAHLFLANSFDRLRDRSNVNLRYDTPWLSEYLVANLLAPVGAGTLSQLVSREEYSRMFERDRLGLVAVTEYGSQGDWFQGLSQHGRKGPWNYVLEGFYRTENGAERNTDFEQLSGGFTVKHQLTPQDGFYLQGNWFEAEYGDVRRYYRPSEVNRGLRVDEVQEPWMIGGYHHAWSPQSHTLMLAGGFEGTLSVDNPAQPILVATDNGAGITDAAVGFFPVDYENEVEFYTAELQQIWERHHHRLILGGSYQAGRMDTFNSLPMLTTIPARSYRVENDYDQLSLYAFHHWRIAPPLRLIAGLGYDRLHYPRNYNSPPVSLGRESKDRFSPKAGFLWSPWEATTLRGGYARSLGGVSVGQTMQLEPSQVAGFVQTFRNMIPESVAAPVSGTIYDTRGLAIDQKFPTGTYLGISAEWLQSEATRHAGLYRGQALTPRMVSTMEEDLDFDEKTLRVSLHQLAGNEVALGAEYRLSYANLGSDYAEVPDGIPLLNFDPHQDLEATLHQARLQALWNRPDGFFAQAEAVFSSQHNDGYSPQRPGEAFWHFNVLAGYRFAQRRAQISLGLLNLTDRNYRLNPLNLTQDLPRERTLVARFSLRL